MFSSTVHQQIRRTKYLQQLFDSTTGKDLLSSWSASVNIDTAAIHKQLLDSTSFTSAISDAVQSSNSQPSTLEAFAFNYFARQHLRECYSKPKMATLATAFLHTQLLNVSKDLFLSSHHSTEVDEQLTDKHKHHYLINAATDITALFETNSENGLSEIKSPLCISENLQNSSPSIEQITETLSTALFRSSKRSKLSGTERRLSWAVMTDFSHLLISLSPQEFEKHNSRLRILFIPAMLQYLDRHGLNFRRLTPLVLLLDALFAESSEGVELGSWRVPEALFNLLSSFAKKAHTLYYFDEHDSGSNQLLAEVWLSTVITNRSLDTLLGFALCQYGDVLKAFRDCYKQLQRSDRITMTTEGQLLHQAFTEALKNTTGPMALPSASSNESDSSTMVANPDRLLLFLTQKASVHTAFSQDSSIPAELLKMIRSLMDKSFTTVTCLNKPCLMPYHIVQVAQTAVHIDPWDVSLSKDYTDLANSWMTELSTNLKLDFDSVSKKICHQLVKERKNLQNKSLQSLLSTLSQL